VISTLIWRCGRAHARFRPWLAAAPHLSFTEHRWRPGTRRAHLQCLLRPRPLGDDGLRSEAVLQSIGVRANERPFAACGKLTPMFRVSSRLFGRLIHRRMLGLWPTRTTLLLCALLAGSAGSAYADAGADSAELLRLERVWNEAHVRGDADTLERLWADDLTVIVPGMSPMGKSEVLAFARSGRMAFSRYETSDVRVQIYGNAATVTGKLLRSRTLDNTLREDHWQFLKVYARLNGRWLVVAFSASEAPAR
jgi:ketosteroid isomerase-like protein